MLQLPLSGIKKIEAFVKSNHDTISLSQGALKIGGVPQKIKQYVKEVLNTDKADYYQSAWGILPLRKKIKTTLNQKYNLNLKLNQIIVTHGCIGALSNIFLTLLEPGDEVIIPEPTYPAYENLTKLARSNPIFISCINENKKIEFEIKKIKKATTPKTKIIIFSNPWNPLGLVIEQEKIKELLNWCEKQKIYLIIDEAYVDYRFKKQNESSVTLLDKSKYLISTFTFSKNMALSGWRVGFVVLPEKLYFNIGQTQDAFLNCTSIPAQYAALYALDHPELTLQFYEQIQQNLELTEKILKPLINKKIFSYQKPQGGFFLFLKSEQENATNLSLRILSEKKVGLIPGKYFGPSGENFIRLCYAREKEILKTGLNRILEIF